jgi:ankyrin repeat protein
VRAVRRLLAAGADPDALAPTVWRQRPLHRTLEFSVAEPRDERHAEIVGLLLDAGANPRLRATARDLTPWELATICGCAGAERRLRPFRVAPDPSAPSALWLASASRVAEARPRNLSKLLEPGSLDQAWRTITPLMMATGHAAKPELAERLLAAGADPSAGVSLLHASCQWHFQHLLPALDWLASHGWEVDGRDEHGQTALHKAAFLGYATAATKLLQLGADPRAVDAEGRTALDVARASRKAAVERGLLKVRAT